MLTKKLKIYVENSVISAYYFAPKPIITATRDFFDVTRKEGYELFTADITLAELEKTGIETREKLLEVIRTFNIKVVPRTTEAKDLADEYIRRRMIPERYRLDAEHIAVASVMGLDVLISWNLAHIVKLKTKKLVRMINEDLGYPVPEIVRPDEVE